MSAARCVTVYSQICAANRSNLRFRQSREQKPGVLMLLLHRRGHSTPTARIIAHVPTYLEGECWVRYALLHPPERRDVDGLQVLAAIFVCGRYRHSRCSCRCSCTDHCCAFSCTYGYRPLVRPRCSPMAWKCNPVAHNNHRQPHTAVAARHLALRTLLMYSRARSLRMANARAIFMSRARCGPIRFLKERRCASGCKLEIRSPT